MDGFVRSHLFHSHIDNRDRQQQVEAGEAGAYGADQLDVMGSSLRRLPHHIGNQPHLRLPGASAYYCCACYQYAFAA